MRRCPYCGEKIQNDAGQCEHCGKTLVKKTAESGGKPGLTNIDSWSDKSVPSWLMYLVIAGALFFLWLMVSQGCSDKRSDQPKDENAFRLSNSDASRLAAVPMACDPTMLPIKMH